MKADVVMPSAMQNDVHMESAKKIAANHVKYYIEVANMPTTNDALRFLMEQPGMIVAPSKAVNAGGVATSAWRWPRTVSGWCGPPRRWTGSCTRSCGPSIR